MKDFNVAKADVRHLLNRVLGEDFSSESAKTGVEVLVRTLVGMSEDGYYHEYLRWPDVLFYAHTCTKEIPGLKTGTYDELQAKIRAVAGASWNSREIDGVPRLHYFGEYQQCPSVKELVYGLALGVLADLDFDDEDDTERKVRQIVAGWFRMYEIQNHYDLLAVVAIIDYMHYFFDREKPMSLQKFLREGFHGVSIARVAKLLDRIDWPKRLHLSYEADNYKPQVIMNICYLALKRDFNMVR